MTANVPKWLWQTAVLALATVLTCTAVSTAAGRKSSRTSANAPTSATVEMFAAIEKGDISVKLIHEDSRRAHVMIENKTDKPLNVKLPEAFAGVPILAQDVGGRSSRNGGSSSSSNQSTGGGMGGMGMGGGGMGMFNVAPERVGKFDVTTVCLEHGKREPRAQVPYEIKPLDSFTSKAGVLELCELLGKGQISQRAAQAAAWHLNNDMSWEQLAAKTIDRANGARYPYFTAAEIQTAMRVANAAVQLSEQKKPKQDTATSRSER